MRVGSLTLLGLRGTVTKETVFEHLTSFMQDTVSKPAVAPEEPAGSTDAYELAEHRLAGAYSDCHRHNPGGYIPQRNLDFCCPVTVSLPEAIRLLGRYVPGYNAFDPALLKVLPPKCRVRLAREGSVCLYVETRAPLDHTLRRRLKCDEFDLYQQHGQTRLYRLWWD